MRLIIVSNRLPITVGPGSGSGSQRRSIGGLATGIESYISKIESGNTEFDDYLWFGWSGGDSKRNVDDLFKSTSESKRKYYPIHLNKKLIDGFYNDFCNKVIWPLFHFFPQYIDHNNHSWKYYQLVNELFYEQIKPHLRADDVIWVHDYHLMLLPRMIRRDFPENPISFFLHIPFPSYTVFCHLPRNHRIELLEGMVGADVVGFHTYGYSKEFLYCVARDLRIADRGNIIEKDGRRVKVDIFPMGIDYHEVKAIAGSALCKRLGEQIIRRVGNCKVILSVDRLDYTKGILNRLIAFSALLTTYPEWRGKVVLMLVVAPSRREIDSYMMMKKEIDEWVGKINGEFCDSNWTPILYQFRQLDLLEMCAMYSVSDVGLITPLCDGMNLTAKEFVVAGNAEKSILILSEMAGAINELTDAIPVNPFSINDIVSAILSGLRMPGKYKAARNRRMHQRMSDYDVLRWASDIIGTTLTIRKSAVSLLPRQMGTSVQEQMIREYRKAKSAVFLLDYDGTLSPLASDAVSARPGIELLALLEQLMAAEGSTVIIISGRDRNTLSTWFKDLNVILVSDFGAWYGESSKWKKPVNRECGWKETYKKLLKKFVLGLPGSYLEEKESVLVWDYRVSDPELKELRISEFRDQLSDQLLKEQQIELMLGLNSLVIRDLNVGKGVATRHFLDKENYEFILAIGDDDVDEDIFKMMPSHGYSVKVGAGQTTAKYQLPGVSSVIDLLKALSKSPVLAPGEPSATTLVTIQ